MKPTTKYVASWLFRSIKRLVNDGVQCFDCIYATTHVCVIKTGNNHTSVAAHIRFAVKFALIGYIDRADCTVAK